MSQGEDFLTCIGAGRESRPAVIRPEMEGQFLNVAVPEREGGILLGGREPVPHEPRPERRAHVVCADELRSFQGVPDPGRPVGAGGYNHRAIRRPFPPEELEIGDLGRVAHCGDHLPAVQIPDAHAPVLAAGGEQVAVIKG